MLQTTATACASGEAIREMLAKLFDDATYITRTQFREFMGISRGTDSRMRTQGQYPRMINLPGASEGRILLIDLAAWLESGGCPRIEGAKKRGRPAGGGKEEAGPLKQ